MKRVMLVLIVALALPLAANASISSAAAQTLAIKAVGGGIIDDIKLQKEGGREYYDVEINHNGQDYDVKIDAQTGVVISKKLD